MTIINIRDAKTHFSKLIDSVMKGEEIIITRRGTPAAKLSPIAPLKHKRNPGALKGKIKMAQDFDAPLSDDMSDQL
ncbi:MAG TPA: type II toxin-antitoxin system Phd/YefM family antitoxin [Gammaproteobacteria bacterium]|nr:type II toxin-antitoxin system Phd/YefM family antitoxin [Gammaproteobacteria bacterium]